MNKRIKSNPTLITQIVPICLVLWAPFAQAGEIKIDVTGMELAGGNITGGTICKGDDDCTVVLKYKETDRTTKTVLLKGGQVKGGQIKSGTLVSGKVGDGSFTGDSLTSANLTEAKISNVEIHNATVLSAVTSSGGLDTTNINQSKEVTIIVLSGGISAAIIDSAIFQVSSAKSGNTAAASGTATNQASDEYDWKGDRIQLQSDFKNIKAASNPAGPDYSALDGAVLDVAVDDKKTGKLTVKFRGDSLNGSKACSDPALFVPCEWHGIRSPARTDLSANTVDGHSTYIIDKSAIENAPHLRRGWSFGALIVPFKYQLSDKSFGNTTTIGPYIGYKFQDSRGSVTPVISAGWVSNIAVPLANGGGSVNRSGFSGAIGVIFSIDKGTGIQMGVLLGQDRLGSSAAAPYAYEGKTWLSLSIGFKFI